jgi:formylglycine-generating enzyme required for sulfatase activity
MAEHNRTVVLETTPVRGRRRRRFVIVTAILLIAITGLLGMGIYRIATDKGQLVIQRDDDGPQLNKLGMRLICVTHGQFHRWFGPPEMDTRFDYDLEVSVTGVTRGQFARFVEESRYETLAEKPQANPLGSFVPAADGGEWVPTVNWKQTGADRYDLPVTCVSWEDAVVFCNWLSQFEGKEPCYARSGEQWVCRFGRDGYRLATEAEWEYAAREGSKELLPVETAAMHDLGWFRPKADGKPHPVQEFIPNKVGLHDVWGNVWGWCWDWYTVKPNEPNGPTTGTERTVWGGGWNDTAEQIAKKPRKGLAPAYRATDVGFRVVRTVINR